MFGFVIGRCFWAPPSAKAALVAVMWLFGAPQPEAWPDYEAAMAQQYVAAGLSAKKAVAEVRLLETCFASWQGERSR